MVAKRVVQKAETSAGSMAVKTVALKVGKRAGWKVACWAVQSVVRKAVWLGAPKAASRVAMLVHHWADSSAALWAVCLAGRWADSMVGQLAEKRVAPMAASKVDSMVANLAEHSVVQWVPQTAEWSVAQRADSWAA